MLIVDAHLDLSMNAMDWNRDLRQPVYQIREREKGMTDKPGREMGTVAFPELRQAHIGLCVATLIARYVKPDNPLPGWFSPQQAWAHTQGQLAWYQAMEAEGELLPIKDIPGLEKHLVSWENKKDNAHPIGYILSLEGADSIVDMGYLEKLYAQGLRALGPAHYGPGVYAFGTDSTGGMGAKGQELLKKMEELNIILDTTHLCDESFWEAMDHFHGHLWASHSNCRKIVDHNRQFADEQIKELINRGAVIGGVLDAWMMIPGWVRGKSMPQNMGLSLEHLIDHYDHICQLAGNSLHVAIGTDLDGGFGKEQCPADMDTIVDLQQLPELLSRRGYTPEDIDNIMYRNWIRFLKKAWA